jgi:hypothetical protein
LAAKADRHEISRRFHDRQVAASEAAISREEDWRNNIYDRASTSDGNPIANLFDAFAGLFR